MPSSEFSRRPAEAEALYGALFENARDVVLLADDSARCLDVNPAGSALLGYSREELLGLTLWDVIAPTSVDDARVLWQRLPAIGHASGQWSMVRKGGGRVTVELTFVANVRPGLHLTIGRDVSERLRDAELLESTDQKYRSLVAHAPLLILAVDAQGRITLSEGRALESVGLEPGQVVGQSAIDLYGTLEIIERSGRRTTGRDVLERVLRGEIIEGSTALSGRYFENSFLPIRNATGSVEGMMGVAYDVTELHRASEALRSNEERFRTVVENISDVITVLDSHGTILYESPSVRRVLGYEPAELIGRNCFELVHPDDLPHLMLAFDVRSPDIVVRRFRSRHRDGTWRTLEAIGRSHGADDGTRTAVIAARDLTERERVHAESQLLQEVTRRVADARDIDTALTSVMRLACDTFGWAFAEAWVLCEDRLSLELSPVWHAAEPRFEVFRGDEAGRRIAAGSGVPGRAWAERRAVWVADLSQDPDFVRHHRARAAGLHTALALPIALDDAATITTVLVLFSARAQEEDARLVALFSAVGAQLGAAIQRKRAEMALHSSQELLQSVVTSAPVIVFVLDSAGVFTLSEGRGLEALGLRSGQLVGASVFDVYRDAPDVVASVRRALAGEAFIGLADVAGRSYQTWYSPRVDANGVVTGALGVATDITERRQLEEQLRQAQKLESVGLLAGGIAHDFNNMLTAITGYAELLMDQLPPDDPKRAEVTEIRRAADKAALLTYQLLAFSRKQILRPKTLNLNDVLTDVSRMLRRLIGEDITIVVRMSDDLGAVTADPGQVAQVILNLAVNARDAMPAGGTLTLETANVELDDEDPRGDASIQDGCYVMLAVSDTGIGMPPEIRRRIFEPFFTTKGVGKGTGMGLATVYGIVKQSGGHVWVYSEVGRGSTFKVFLPRIEQAERPRDSSADEATFASGSETVLLVEDEEVVRRLARRALESCGYTVLEATDGSEALALCDSSAAPIHLLVTDVVMPKMGGRELVEQLSSRRPRLKILYMSGYTDNAIVHHGTLEPGTNFIQKPFTMRALAHKVREVLDGPTS